MKFTVDTKDFSGAVLSVSKALPVRTTMPSLEGIYAETKNGTLTLKCSDLMIQKECRLAAVVEEDGAVILPGKLFCELVRKLPDSTVSFEVVGKQVNIKCGRLKTNIQALDFEEFPEMRFNGEVNEIQLKRDDCRQMINQTVFAAAQDDSKPILTGVLFEIEDSVTAVSTDAYQFAMRNVPLLKKRKNSSMVIPAKTLMEISRVAEEADETITLNFTTTHVKVDLGHTCLTARLLDGDYIKYKQLIPKEYKTRVLLNREELIMLIDRAQLVAREGNNNIIMDFSDNKLYVRANSFIGKSNEDMDVQMSGDNIEIAFNPKYCMNVLKNITEETVAIDFLSNISPCVVHPVDNDSFTYLIVPVRIYSQV